jgi:putative ABC transport system ATP-binding protein
MPAPLLECLSVTKRYAERVVLREVSLVLQPGERLALTGPSGSGKTTLLNCLGGIDRPDSGEIRLFGNNLSECDAAALAALRRARIGTIFQFFHLLPTLSVRENVEFPLQLLGFSQAERRARATTLLERVRMQHRAEAFPSQISGGEMQRTAIARALAPSPPLLLADEPTGNLDSANGAVVLQLLREMTEETGTALVLVTHSAEAAAICHRTLRMRDGQLDTADAPSSARSPKAV